MLYIPVISVFTEITGIVDVGQGEMKRDMAMRY